MLGICCENGLGTEKDIERADYLYKQSREGGSIVGVILTETEYDRGIGVLAVYGLHNSFACIMIICFIVY
jgi:hypothetical protein